MMNATPQYYKSAIDATGCISNAWNLIKPNYGMFLGISLLTYVIIACIPCLNVFLMGPIMGGFYYTALKAMRGEPIEFGMLFKGFERFVPLMVVGLIQSIPSIIYQGFDLTIRFGNIGIESILNDAGSRGNFFQEGGVDPRIIFASGYFIVILIVAAVLIIFSVLWAITFAFAIPIAMENESLSPIDALKLSAKASWSNVGGIIVLAILSFLLGMAGVLALCIGFLFVLPIIWVSWAFAYRQVFPDLGPTIFRNEPPPPDAYQGSFGQGS